MTLRSAASSWMSEARQTVSSGDSTPVPQGSPVTVRLEPRVVWVPSGSKHKQSIRLHITCSPPCPAEGSEEPDREKAATLISHIIRTAKAALEERHPEWDSEVCTAAFDGTSRELQVTMDSLGANVVMMNDLAKKTPQLSEQWGLGITSDNDRNTSCECPTHFAESKVPDYLQRRKFRPVVRFWNREDESRRCGRRCETALYDTDPVHSGNPGASSMSQHKQTVIREYLDRLTTEMQRALDLKPNCHPWDGSCIQKKDDPVGYRLGQNIKGLGEDSAFAGVNIYMEKPDFRPTEGSDVPPATGLIVARTRWMPVHSPEEGRSSSRTWLSRHLGAS